MGAETEKNTRDIERLKRIVLDLQQSLDLAREAIRLNTKSINTAATILGKLSI